MAAAKNLSCQVKEIQYGKGNSTDTFHSICMGKIDHCLSQIFYVYLKIQHKFKLSTKGLVTSSDYQPPEKRPIPFVYF